MAEDNKVIFSMVGVGKTIPPQKKILNNIYLSFFYGAKIGILGLNPLQQEPVSILSLHYQEFCSAFYYYTHIKTRPYQARYAL